MTIVGQEKPSVEDALAHFGVKGMKWGQRQKANGKQIVEARRNLKAQSKDYRKTAKGLKNLSVGSSARKALEKKLSEKHQEYLKNPDRAIASRMTRGEKATALLFGTSTGIGLAVTIGSIAGTSIASRRIEKQQEDGAFDGPRTGPVKKRIGFQTGRALTISGAHTAGALIDMYGPVLATAIRTKAHVNRVAAQTAYRNPKGLASTAAKIAYSAKKRGAYKITTLK